MNIVVLDLTNIPKARCLISISSSLTSLYH